MKQTEQAASSTRRKALSNRMFSQFPCRNSWDLFSEAKRISKILARVTQPEVACHFTREDRNPIFLGVAPTPYRGLGWKDGLLMVGGA